MSDTSPGGVQMDLVVHFLNGASKAPVNSTHVLVPTTEQLRNNRRVLEDTVGTTIPTEDESPALVVRVGSRETDQVLARRRAAARRSA